jgi:hypothetical protein
VVLKKVTKAVGLLLLAGLLLTWGNGFAQQQTTQDGETKEVVSSGIGSIVGGDIAHARDDAIEDALRTGVEQALGLLLSSESLVDNFQLIEDKIFTKTQGYVQNYQIISEKKRDEYLYEVTVQAHVKMSELKDDIEGIRTLMRRKNTPRMMIMIDERNIGEAPGALHYFEADMNNAETALMEALMQKGFKFVDQATVKGNLQKQQAAAILEGDAAKAAALGRSVGAEVVVTGKALAKATEVEVYGTKQRSQQATVNVRAIRSDTGDIIAITSGQGAFPHIDDVVGGAKAIQRACDKISETLVDQILDRWQADISSGATITLNVRGITGFSMLSKFKASLPSYVRKASSIVQRDWSGEFATFEVEMTGNADDLAQRLSGKNIEGIYVKVVGLTQNSVTVELSQGQ